MATVPLTTITIIILCALSRDPRPTRPRATTPLRVRVRCAVRTGIRIPCMYVPVQYRSAALHTNGAAGPSGLDALGWRKAVHLLQVAIFRALPFFGLGSKTSLH